MQPMSMSMSDDLGRSVRNPLKERLKYEKWVVTDWPTCQLIDAPD